MHVSMSLQGAVSDKKPLANDEHVSKLFPTVLRFDVCICRFPEVLQPVLMIYISDSQPDVQIPQGVVEPSW